MKYVEVAAILVGRFLQSGMLFLINLVFMSNSESALYVDIGVATAWAAPLSLIAMFGGYISATQIKSKDSLKESNLLQAYLIYRPLFFLSVLILCLYAVVNYTTSFFIFIFSFTTFLVLVGIADAFLFCKKIGLFIVANVLLSFLVGLSSFLVLNEAANLYAINFIWLFGVLILASFLTTCNIITKPGIRFFIKHLQFFLVKNVGPSIIVIMSSVSLGVFLVIDRLLLPFYVTTSDLANYFAAITLALPLNFLAVIHGKHANLNTYHSRFEERSGAESRLRNIFILLLLGLLILPIQWQILIRFTEYEFDILIQTSLNLAACLIILSKPSLAEIYARKRLRIISGINIFLIAVLVPAMIYFSSSFISIGLLRFGFNLLYLFLIISVLKSLWSSYRII
ncbi:hypothetical protein OAP03_00485 [Gammaproteobacteria bacterium]|nr:hypothetical protein [Gammaproteobacteria bacterium]